MASPLISPTLSPSSSSRDRWLILVLLVLFVALGLRVWWNADAEDLASSFVGCRLLAEGHPEALFNYDPDNFPGIGPGHIWQDFAVRGHFNGFIHPYVQTPLWGWGLQPLCTRVNFPVFSRIFCLLVMASFAGALWFIARYWAPTLFHPLPVAVILVGLWASQPFQYAMFLMQTHALFFFLAIASLILAERNRPAAAGFLLASAAAVKVTPIFLVLYWLLTRRLRAAAWAVGWSAVLMAATVWAVGPHLVGTYFADLQRISRVLLVAENNQSLAAWWMGHYHPEDDVFDADIFPLPTPVRLTSMALTLGFTALGGWLDRPRPTLRGEAAAARPPIGAMMALVAATIFAPIAWTHYSVILVAPLMVLVDQARRRRSWAIGAWAIVIALLNYPPLASDIIPMDLGTYALLRGQFYAGVLALAGMGYLWWDRRRAPALPPA